MLLSTQQERLDANKRNRTVILEFLCCHRYSTLQNIAYELGHKSTATASRILKRLCAERLVKKEAFKDDIFNVTLFGITKQGIGFLDQNVEENLHFIPSRVSLRNLKHTLVNQKVASWMKTQIPNLNNKEIINTEFGNLKKLSHIIEIKHRPDLLLTGTYDGKKKVVYLIETELSLKESKRYKKIWLEYILLKKKGKISGVIYLVKNESAAERLKGIMNKLKFHLLDTGDDQDLLDRNFTMIPIDKYMP